MTDKPDPLQRFTDVQQEIETALTQPEQKPVAWMYEWDNKKHLTFTDQSFVEKAHPHFNKSTPLYTAPPEQKPVVWLSTDSIGEMYLPTPPQKREWQGLTDEEYNRLVMEHLGPHALTGGKMSVYDAFLLAIRATEAKLKEKND